MTKRKAKRKPTRKKKPTARELHLRLDTSYVANAVLTEELHRTKAALGYALEQVEEAKVLLGDKECKTENYDMGAGVGHTLNLHEQRIASLEYRLRGK